MAIYEYWCPGCKKEFELRRPIVEADDPGRCPECGAEGRKLISNFGSKTGSYIQAPGRVLREESGRTE